MVFAILFRQLHDGEAHECVHASPSMKGQALVSCLWLVQDVSSDGCSDLHEISCRLIVLHYFEVHYHRAFRFRIYEVAMSDDRFQMSRRQLLGAGALIAVSSSFANAATILGGATIALGT